MADRVPKNYIGEWYGRRLYPDVKCTGGDVDEFRAKQCPFLSSMTRSASACVKPSNSSGVCTITTTKNGVRDWMVCPYRALDPSFLRGVVARLFFLGEERLAVYPVVTLGDEHIVSEMKTKAQNGTHVFIFFQDKLGGEINVSPTLKSPELSFDITLLPVEFDGPTLRLATFALYEVQTMDFHGSYRHAVSALNNALDLHGTAFPEVLRANTEWLGRKIEGPNVANVFKRTFYQLLLKFSLAGHADCVGVALGLPSAVWQSWSPHLGAPELVPKDDYFILKETPRDVTEKSWIVVFGTDRSAPASPECLVAEKVINVGAGSLLAHAFHEVPEQIARHALRPVKERILSRVRAFYARATFG